MSKSKKVHSKRPAAVPRQEIMAPKPVRLIDEGRMAAAGLAEVESARADFSARCGLPADEFFADSFTSAADKAA